MIEITNLRVSNFDGALRGMRNPLESWDKSDSRWNADDTEYIVGEEDKKLALNLIRAGSDHAKFMRQIFVSMDIKAPMTWWWDMDTYKVATVRNSTSRMHKLGKRLLTPEDFSFDDEYGKTQMTPFREMMLNDINQRIRLYQQLTKEGKAQEAKNLFREIVLDLPASYNFLSTWSGNYENLHSIYHARKNHKQKEFRDFCKIIEEECPNSEFITTSRRRRRARDCCNPT